jgi:DNA repair exonuclease SbcCD ATPase subunit
MLYGLVTMPRGDDRQDAELDMTLTNFLTEMREMDRTRTQNEQSRTNTVLREIQAVHRKIDSVSHDLGQKIKGVEARVSLLEQRLDTSPSSNRRIPTSDPPTAHELGLKPSKSGQVSFEEVQHAMAVKLTELDTEIRESNAREEGAREALEQEKKRAEEKEKAERERWNFRIKLFVALSPTLLALGAYIAHALHL